ncbi:MAG: GGDEF domain-containing protein [Propionibacteriales bacterium]|nr:GGDEF domain-containing protein [Propionibacteriales bacterium]
MSALWNPHLATSARDRDSTATDRDKVAVGRDATADERDGHSDERDARADVRESVVIATDSEALGDRRAALHDRQAAGADRVNARFDRLAAASDRTLAERDRAELLLDELTGFYRRAAGFLALDREIVKAERTAQPFVLVFVDVDGLKAVNDQHGHEAGDLLLREVARCIRAVLRDYDICIRYGGDEFICAVTDLSLPKVAARFEAANEELNAVDHASVSVGLVERAPGEELPSLIGRADAAMYDARQQRDPSN